MAESGGSQTLYGSSRKKRKPRERPPYRDREYRESFGGRSDPRKDSRDYVPLSREKSGLGITTTPKQPIILAKPESGDVAKQKLSAARSLESDKQQTLKQRKEVHSSEGSVTEAHRSKYTSSSYSSSTPHKSGAHDRYYGKSLDSEGSAEKSKKNTVHNIVPSHEITVNSLLKEVRGSQEPVKLLDSSLHWADAGIEHLRDQTDFLVVGVLGMQGVGKSMIMSMLAGNNSVTDPKKLIFPTQTQDKMERATNETSGVDMYVTEERVIFLDAQPILSPSLLEQYIYNDRKMSAEYNGPAIGVEMQSLQIATLFFSICHVVLVVQDYFTDHSIFQFLQTAEMLKLSMPTNDISNLDSEFHEFYPHVIFVYNKAEPALFDPGYLMAMNEIISSSFKHSKLLYKGSTSLFYSLLYPYLVSQINHSSLANIFIIPKILSDSQKNEIADCGLENQSFTNLPQYLPNPDLETVFSVFTKMILSVHKVSVTHQTVSEKNWFYYAAKTWETLKKSQLVSEYSRLLT